MKTLTLWDFEVSKARAGFTAWYGEGLKQIFITKAEVYEVTYSEKSLRQATKYAKTLQGALIRANEFYNQYFTNDDK